MMRAERHAPVLIRSLMVAVLAVLAGCGRQAPTDAQAPQTGLVAQATALETPEGQSDDDDGIAGPPTTEKEMYGYQFEVMAFPPPLGPNGEPRTFEADSTAARGFTGTVTFSALPIPAGSDSPTHPIRMQGANGVTYDLRMVENGGVDAIATIDWSKLMLRPIGMADYLKAATKPGLAVKTADLASPGTLVFVYEVIKPAKSGNAGVGPGCGTSSDSYIALTAPSEEDYLSLATFSAGPWPPADNSRNCGLFNYAPAKTGP